VTCPHKSSTVAIESERRVLDRDEKQHTYGLPYFVKKHPENKQRFLRLLTDQLG
jgi:hypothetical protein